MSVRFEWDINKNDQNIKKHGISFDEAEEIFLRPNESFLDELNSIGEIRYKTIGATSGGKIILVSHTDGGSEGSEDEIIRIISARKLTRTERKKYVKSTATRY